MKAAYFEKFQGPVDVRDVPKPVAKAGRGAHVFIDAPGSRETCFRSVSCLRTRGKRIPVGLMISNHLHPKIHMDKVVANELEIMGSRHMQPFCYAEMFEIINTG